MVAIDMQAQVRNYFKGLPYYGHWVHRGEWLPNHVCNHHRRIQIEGDGCHGIQPIVGRCA
jgi:hypothetical protein